MSEDNKNKQDLKSLFEKNPEETKGESTGRFLLGDNETLFSQNRFKKKTKYSPLIIPTWRIWSFTEKDMPEVKNPITEHGQNKACDIMNRYESKNSGGGIQTQPRYSPADNVSIVMRTVSKILNTKKRDAGLSGNIEWLHAVARNDPGRAYCELARCYEFGTSSIPEDLDKAWRFYSEAAKAGNAEAYNKIKTEFCSPQLTDQDIRVIDDGVINKILQGYEGEIERGNKVVEYSMLGICANYGDEVALYKLGKYHLQSWDPSRGTDTNLRWGIHCLKLSEQTYPRARLEKLEQMVKILGKAYHLAASGEFPKIQRAKLFYVFILRNNPPNAITGSAKDGLEHVEKLLGKFKKPFIPLDSPLYTKRKTDKNEKKDERNTKRETFSKKH